MTKLYNYHKQRQGIGMENQFIRYEPCFEGRFVCPDAGQEEKYLFDQGLLFLSADCPYRQDQFHSEQYQNEQSHFQNREFVGTTFPAKALYSFFCKQRWKPKPNMKVCEKKRPLHRKPFL